MCCKSFAGCIATPGLSGCEVGIGINNQIAVIVGAAACTRPLRITPHSGLSAIGRFQSNVSSKH